MTLRLPLHQPGEGEDKTQIIAMKGLGTQPTQKAESLDHAREMPAAVRRGTHDAALEIQPNPNEATLELGLLQKLVHPLILLIKDREATPGKAFRPLHKLTIVRSKTTPEVGDEQYLENDISEIEQFMKTDRYQALAPAVKASISEYLMGQKELVKRIATMAEDAEVDRTDIIKPVNRHPQAPSQKSRLQKLLGLLGIN